MVYVSSLRAAHLSNPPDLDLENASRTTKRPHKVMSEMGGALETNRVDG